MANLLQVQQSTRCPKANACPLFQIPPRRTRSKCLSLWKDTLVPTDRLGSKNTGNIRFNWLIEVQIMVPMRKPRLLARETPTRGRHECVDSSPQTVETASEPQMTFLPRTVVRLDVSLGRSSLHGRVCRTDVFFYPTHPSEKEWVDTSCADTAESHVA